MKHRSDPHGKLVAWCRGIGKLIGIKPAALFCQPNITNSNTQKWDGYNRQMPKTQIVIHEPPTIQINIEILIRKRKKKYIFNTNSSNLLSSFFLQTYLLSTLTLWWYNKAPFILYMYMFGPDQARHANIPIRYLLCFLFQFESPSNIIQATFIVLCLRSFDYTLSPQLRSTILFWNLIKNLFFL